MDLPRQCPSFPEQNRNTRKFANRQLESHQADAGPNPRVGHFVSRGLATEQGTFNSLPCLRESPPLRRALGNERLLTVLDFANGGVHLRGVSWASSLANSSVVVVKSFGRLCSMLRKVIT